jgi:RHS repeat-associated protein
VSGAATAGFGYDGDGKRMIGTEGGTSTVYIGNYFEWKGSTTTMVRYYYAGAERVAMRTGTADPLWLVGDHLGSTSVAANYDGSTGPRQGYKAWGEKRFPTGTSPLPTTFRYTGQRESETFGLYFYGARWYDSSLGRFTSPDTVIPETSQGVQAWDRYAYTNNNPMKYNDPSGHMIDDGCKSQGCEISQATQAEINYARQRYNAQNCKSGAGGGCGNYAGGALFFVEAVALPEMVVAGGAVTTGTLVGAVSGGIAGFAGYGINTVVNRGNFNWDEAGEAATTGAINGGFFGGVGGGLGAASEDLGLKMGVGMATGIANATAQEISSGESPSAGAIVGGAISGSIGGALGKFSPNASTASTILMSTLIKIFGGQAKTNWNHPRQ